MAAVVVEQRDDGWWLAPDWQGEPDRLLGVGEGPYASEAEADRAAALYLQQMTSGGLGDDPIGPPWHGRTFGDPL